LEKNLDRAGLWEISMLGFSEWIILNGSTRTASGDISIACGVGRAVLDKFLAQLFFLAIKQHYRLV
jgi:hypothetical protein